MERMLERAKFQEINMNLQSYPWICVDGHQKVDRGIQLMESGSKCEGPYVKLQ